MDLQSSASSSQFSNSSNTDGSQKSGKSEGQVKELDFTKDNTLSPIDLEALIQAERLTAIIDEVIYKSKMVICLPHLIGEYNTLSSILTKENMEDLLIIFEQYEKPCYSSINLLNIAALEDIRAGDMKLKNRLSPELSHLIYIMSKYPTLKQKVEDLIEETKVHYAETPDDIPPNIRYLQTLEQFRELLVEQLETTAAEELSKKLHMRRVSQTNERLKNDIHEFLKTMKEEQAEFERSMKEKFVLRESLKKELEVLSYDCNEAIKKKVLDTDRQMVLMTRSHVVKSEILKEEEAENAESFKNLLANHLAEEKKQRQHRFKVQGQLQSWVQKYDTEMGDKQTELDDMIKQYEEERDKVEKLEADMAEQDVEYIPLMEEREAEYHEEMTRKMNEFLRDHAARVIQFAWRTVLANRAEKKRLKKLQKKLEKEAAAMSKKKK